MEENPDYVENDSDSDQSSENEIANQEEVEQDTSPRKISMLDVDLLTLECFTNKNVYKKIMSHKNPETYKKKQEFEYKKNVYREKILEITQKMIEEEDSAESVAPNKDILDSFNEYIKNVISYIEYEERISMDYKPNYDYDGSGKKNHYDKFPIGGKHLFSRNK